MPKFHVSGLAQELKITICEQATTVQTKIIRDGQESTMPALIRRLGDGVYLVQRLDRDGIVTEEAKVSLIPGSPDDRYMASLANGGSP